MSGAARDRAPAPGAHPTDGKERWEQEIAAVPGATDPVHNRSGIEFIARHCLRIRHSIFHVHKYKPNFTYKKYCYLSQGK